eukprot:g31066.t1
MGNNYWATEILTCFKKTTIIPVTKKAHATCLNDYCSKALTSIILKCFERLVMAHINSSLPSCLAPLQLAYRHDRSTEDAISLALHSSLEHLDNKDTNVRILLIDYSSTFNTIVPSRLMSKLGDLSLRSAFATWFLTILTHRLQSVRIGTCTSSTTTLKKLEAPTYVPPKDASSAPYYLYTYDRVAEFQTNAIYKFADDTIV